MPSKRKLAPVVGRDGISSGSSAREQDVATVELDTTFSKVLGLAEGQKVVLVLSTTLLLRRLTFLGRNFHPSGSPGGTHDQH